MKFNSKNIFIYIFVVFVIGIFAYSFMFFPTGYVGTTRKNQVNLGCVCHGDTATSSVTVQIIGPDSIPAGTTVLFRVKTSHGPAIKGGFNLAHQRDAGNDSLALSQVPGDTMVRRQDGELTHTNPKPFDSDTVSWVVRYTASSVVGWDTLFATSNSTNGNGNSEGDNWNWSLNKPIRIYNPIGIINISSIAENFSLSQNYPNPFNPVTKIKFDLPESAYASLIVYDVSGKLVSTLVNEKLNEGVYEARWNAENFSSGIYFYRFSSGSFSETMKMVLVK